MITCRKCHRFVSNAIVTYIKGDGEVIMIMADCKKHGRTEADYTDYEELGLDF